MCHHVLDRSKRQSLIDSLAVATTVGQGNVSRRKGNAYAIRNLLEAVPKIGIAAMQPPLIDLAGAVLGSDAMPVKAILFDKTSDANWHVGWHQDQVIAVAERIDSPGFGPWSVKAGIPHVRPSADVLEKMLALRIHLDDCDAANGVLRVIPGTHQAGLLDSASVQAAIENGESFVCIAQAGDVLLMRPLLLHSSTPASMPSHRRVIHIEYAAGPLGYGLSWPGIAAHKC